MSRPRTTRSSRWIVRTTLIALAAASSVGLQSAMSPPGAAAADPATSSAATSTLSASADSTTSAADASVPGDGTSQSPAVLVSKLTGPGSVSDTDTRWKITGTDLGIAWDNGANGILTLYGDTFGDWSGPGGGGGDWRSNVLVRSTDTDLTDGVTYSSAPEDRPGHAKELIPSAKVDNVEMTTIPTAAIHAGNGRQLMAYMSVRHWGPPGLWDTNFNQFAWSDDDGENWSTEGAPRWENTAAGDHPFQMVAFAQRGGYLYMWGTPNGRVGAGHVARVPQASWADKGAWRYWDGKRWGALDLAAAPVVPAPVSELSVAWNEHTRSFVMMYLLGGDIVLRHSTTPQGPWSEPQVLASFADYPALYGGYIDPRSSGSDLYFSMSQWNPYNSYLMRVSLDRDANVVNPNLVHDSGWERQTGSGTSAPWVCTGQCGTDANQAIAAAGDHNGWVRNNRGWNSLHQDVRVKANTDYVFTGWIRTSENNDNGYIGVRTPQLQVIGEHNFRAVGEWTRVQIPFNSGDRTSVQTFAGIWTDNGDMWLQTDTFSIVEAAGATPPPDGVAANVSATSQCNRKTAQLQVRVTNDAGIPVAVTVETALGTKSKAKLARGATYAVAFQAAPDRRRLPSGTVTVTVSGQRDGQPVSQTYTVAYRAVTC